jgi:hypothetical protein
MTSRLEQRWAAVDNGDGTPRRTATDAMAQGGKRRDATGSSQRLGWSTLARGVARISSVGNAVSSRGNKMGLGGYQAS